MVELHLICGDARTAIRSSSSVDLICIDPPYNLNKYSTGNIETNWHTPFNNDIAAWDAEDFYPEQWVDEFTRILKPTGNLFAFTTYNHIGKWHRAYDRLERKEQGLKPIFSTFQLVTWHIEDPPPKNMRAGFRNACQHIVACWNQGHTWNYLENGPGSGFAMHNFISSKRCQGKEQPRLQEPNKKHLSPMPRPRNL